MAYDPYAKFGGKSAYITSQQSRYKSAANNPDLLKKIEADAQRVGYTLPSQTTNKVDELRTAMNNTPNTIDPNSIYADIYNRLNQAYTPFSYNQATDPAYQQAIANARANAENISSNTMVSAGRRGIGNSTIAVNDANRAAQQYVSNVESNILPQLIEQAYQRYIDQQTAERNRNLDLLGIGKTLSDLKQQDWQNRFTYGQAIGRFQNGQVPYSVQADQRNFDYQQARDIVGDKQFQQKLEQDAKQFAEQMGFNWAKMSQDQKQFAAEMVMKQKQLDTRNQSNVDMVQEKQGMVDALRSGKITPEKALQQIEEDTKLGFYTPEQAAELQSVIDTLTPNLANTKNPPKLTEEQSKTLPSDAKLNKLYETDPTGRSSGVPLIDWKDWYRSPQGRLAGVDFQTWARLYGPRISG